MDPTFAAFLGLLSDVPVLGPVLPYLPLVCGLAAIADALIPPPAQGSRWVPVRQVAHVLGLNFGYARNAVPAGAIPATVAAHAAELRAAASAVEGAAGTLSEAVRRAPEAVPSPSA